MRRIKEVIDKKRGIARTASVAFFCQEAEKIIKELVSSDQLRVKKYQNRVLFLAIKNPSVAQRVFNQQRKITKKLGRQLKKPIRRVSYRIENF